MPSQIQLKRTFGVGLPDFAPVGTGVTDGELVYVYDTSNIGAGGTFRKLYIGDGQLGVSSLPSPVGGQYYMERLPDDLTQEGVLLPRKVLSVNGNSVIDRIQVGSGLSVSGISTFKNDVVFEANVDITGDLSFDEFTARQFIVTGVGTINDSLSIGVNLDAPNAYIAAGLVTSLVGTYGTITTFDAETGDIQTLNVNAGLATDLAVTNLRSQVGIITNAYIDVGVVTSLTGTAATITTVDVTNLVATDLTLRAGIFTDIQVSGASTVVGDARFESDVYVLGDLNVTGDIVYDEVRGRNLSISGVGTIANFNSGLGTITTLDSETADLNDVKITSGIITSQVGTYATINTVDIETLDARDVNITGLAVTDIVGTAATITTIDANTADLVAANINVGMITSAYITAGIVTDIQVSGASTVVGVATFQNDVYVAGNLNVIGDVVYDEVTGRNINISGVGTIANLITTGISTIPTLDVENLDALDAKITTGLVTSLTGTYATITDTLTVGTAITFRSGIVSATTLTGEIVRVDTAIYDSNNNVGAANSILTISGGKLIWQNPQEANISTSFAPGSTYFVAENGSDANQGNRAERPWRTIAYALANISDIGENDILNIGAGVYEETFPLTVPEGLTVKGAGLRATKVMPTTATQQKDGFLMNNRTVVEDLTIGGQYFDTAGNQGYAFKYAPGIGITQRSPYVQRVTVLNFGSNTTADDPYGYSSADSPPSSYIAGGGAYIDGSEITSDSLEAGFLFNECTFIVPNSKGIEMTNGARVEFLNCFSYFAATGIEGTSGTVGLASDGKTRLRATGLTTDVGVGNTVTYFDTDGVTGLATGIVASADATYFRISGKSTGFEVLSNRTAQAVTFNGDAQLSTNFPKFGTASLYLDGTNDSISAETAGGFGFGSNDFTVEFFIRPDEITGKKTIFDLRNGSASDTALNIVSVGASIGVQVGATTAILGNTGLSTGTYYHIALARESTSTKLFINGTQEGSTYSDSNDYGSTKPMVLGAEYDGATGAYKGYIDEFRVEKDVSKYTSNFTAPVAELLGDRDTSVLLHFNGAAGVTTTSDDIIVNQDIRITQAGGGIGTATKFTLADFSQFGADMRSVGCALEYGQKGVVADGDGVTLRFFAVNFNFIGSGGDFSNDPNLAIQANEVTELNNGEVSYVSIDHKGDFRVGEAFFVDQENGTVSFTNQVTSLQALSSLTITDGTNSSVITPTSGQFGNVTISGNNIETLSGDLNIDPAGSGEVNIVGNVNVAGILTASVVQIDAFQKGDTSVALDDGGSNGTIRFNTDGVEGMRLDNNQNLGIGTASPRAKLDVIGQTLVENITATGISTLTQLDSPLGEFNTINISSGFATNFTFSGIATFQSDVHFGDNDKINFGDDNDLQIYHTGNTGNVDNFTGDLRVLSDNTYFLNAAGSEYFAKFNVNSSVDLYYDAVKKFETTTHGVTITGGTLVSAASTFSTDLHVVGSIRATNLHSNGGDLVIRGGGNTSTRAGFVLPNSTSADVQINGPSSGSSDIVIDTRGTGEVVIKASGSQKFATTAFGIDITGHTETDTLQVSGITTAANIEIGSASNNTINSKTGALTLNSEIGSNVAISTHVNIVGFLSATDGIYYDSGDYNGPNGIAFFDGDGLIVSSGATTSGITTSNYLLTTNASGVPVWTDVFDGGSF
jgi:hypothetical protein